MHRPSHQPRGGPPDGRHERLRLDLTVLVLVSTAEALTTGARFHYDPADPLAVHMEFPGTPEPSPPWALSRDVLYAGLRAPSGEGGVRVWPPCRCHGTTTVRILLRGRHATAVLYVPAAELRDWLDATFTAVPAGTEGTHLRWDDVLDRIRRSR
ncbi:SsgA family sporulation/cell division regulator [Streptomyces sp. NPDC001388]|uniref:SsgA family sporulation/cell division regulator n=1 Tax=unclassified Streptomyces TaxID=2593676 RepID=UPI00368A700B